MTTRITVSNDLDQLKGRQVSTVAANMGNQLVLEFADGASLTVQWREDGLQTWLSIKSAKASPYSSQNPTKRQLEYLVFIQKYFSRYGRAPAESDIERHFLVSAPSVNQMMQMLERRGFITRQPGVPRSARISIDLNKLT